MNRKLLEFERQKCPIPSGVFGEPVVSNYVRPDLSGRQVVDSHSRDIAHPKELCRFDSAVSGDYSIGGVDQDRIDKSEFCDARGDLPDLPSSMRPWFLCPRLELAGVFIDDLQCSHVPPYRRRRRPVTHHFLRDQKGSWSRPPWSGWATPEIAYRPKNEETLKLREVFRFR
jgi:hypothetical protein